MKLVVVLLVTLTVLCAGQSVRSSLPDASVIRNYTSTTGALKVKRIRLKGNKLIVTGENFDDGATIVINGNEANTRNDSDSPTTTLIAKKGGKKIPLEGIFGLHVENSDGEPSFPLEYFRSASFLAPVLPRWGYPFSVNLQVGDHLFVGNLGSATRWFADLSIIGRVFDVRLPSSDDWLFQAVRPGFTQLYAESYHGGDAPPERLYDIGIIVE